jgi:hypothetical protein
MAAQKIRSAAVIVLALVPIQTFLDGASCWDEKAADNAMISQYSGPADTNGGQFKRGHGVLDQMPQADRNA